MTLSIQSIRSFLANQSSSPTLQSGGNTPAVSSANQVQDTYSFSVAGTSRAVGAKEGPGSLELLRARYAAFQDSLPALQDSAVLESNRTNFNIFRNTVERLKEAEKESQATRQETTTLPQSQEFEPKLVEKIAGIPIPSTARRQLDPASLLKYSFGESTTNTIVSTFDVQPPPAPQPVTRSQTAEEIAAPVYTPLLPPQPDTTQIGVRDREQQGGFIPTPRQNRLQEDVSTVATGLVPPNQTTGLFPTTTPSIPAANARRSLAIDGEENNNALLQPPGRDNNDRVGLTGRRPSEQRQNQLGIGTEQEVGAPVPPANVAPANNPTAETTLAGATTGINNLFSLRGTLVRTPTELRQQAIAKQEATTPNADLPLARRVTNTPAQTATGATQGTTEEANNTTQNGNGLNFAVENQATPFIFFNGFQGRPGEPNPSTLPRAAELNFTNGATNSNFGIPPLAQETTSPLQNDSANNSTNFQPVGRRVNRPNPNQELPTPANNPMEPATTRPRENQPQEQANPNPTLVPVNRSAALSYYARLGGFGREMDASQGPTVSLVA